MKFLITLALIVRSLHEPDKIIKSVQNPQSSTLSRRDAKHFTPYGNALLRTLKKLLGPKYTRDVADAWEAAFRILARVMKQAAY
jgi:nitric oxide dioxygenase